MKLSYRGTRYNSHATEVATNETQIIAKYRGLAYRVRQVEPSKLNEAAL